jgi:hypothetical protein
VSTTTAATRIRPLPESRPPCLIWLPGVAPAPNRNQPTLDLDADPPEQAASRPRGMGVQATVVRARWTVRQSARLPDARAWSSTLAVALVETMHGHRPTAQLNRWVEEDVLAAIAGYRRRRRFEQTRTTVPPSLRSVRLQHPSPEVAEVSAHVVIGRRSVAIAFRLEAAGDRWLCTAAEFGPRA